MATSQKAFDQVKSILGKLDRNIDSVRQRRMGDPVPARPVTQAIASGTQVNGTPGVLGPTLNTVVGGGSGSATQAAVPAQAPVNHVSKSGYGRAQPLRSSHPEAKSA